VGRDLQSRPAIINWNQVLGICNVGRDLQSRLSDHQLGGLGFAIPTVGLSTEIEFVGFVMWVGICNPGSHIISLNITLNPNTDKK
jgi:hypothetical protein